VAFTSWQYVAFLGIALLAARVLLGGRARKGALLIASCAFYAFWDPRFVPLLLGMAVFSHAIALGINARQNQTERKTLLVTGIVVNLGVLGLFKYLGFLLRTLDALIPVARLPLANLILPVGISFVTFEVLSYLIDVYRGDSPADTWLDFVLLVMFFPHLFAGPILKPREFIPQLVSDINVSYANIEAALPQFLLGLVKKALIADTLAMFVNPVFASPMRFSTLTAWLAVVAYALQIYCDFSGYSDMAIASARCFGLSIPANFDVPYVSRSISEFWRRWHISLMRWFREYVYFPLGGSREGKARTYVNVMIVFLLSGLWHGAGWTFVVWGGLHGLAMCVQRAWSGLTSRWRSAEPTVVGGALGWILTLLFVCMAWVVFRSPTLGDAFVFFTRLFTPDALGITWVPVSMLVCLPLVVAAHVYRLRAGSLPTLRLSTFWGAFAVTTTVLVVLVFMPQHASPFIYFQF